MTRREDPALYRAAERLFAQLEQLDRAFPAVPLPGWTRPTMPRSPRVKRRALRLIREAMLAARKEQARRMEPLIRVGGQLSNLAFNWSQSPGVGLDERRRECARATYQDWDRLRAKLRDAR